MSNEQRQGPWIGMRAGEKFWPCDPRPEDVRLPYIASTLSMIPRFGGRTCRFYSVAQHCVWVGRYMETRLPGSGIHGLLHDAAEAYVGDVITPIKKLISLDVDGLKPWRFEQMEMRITEAIYLRLQLPMPQPAEVSLLHEADEMALAVEARDLMGDPDWPGLRNADGYTLDAQTQWAFEVAARQYEAQVVAMSRTCRHERRRRLGHNGGA